MDRRSRSKRVGRSRRYQDGLALQTQYGAVDQSRREQLARAGRAGFERVLHFMPCQFADVAGDQTCAEIAVGLQIMCRTADDGGMSGQIDRVGNDGGGSVSLRCRPRQHGDGVGDTKRETASVASAGGNPSRGIVGIDDDGSHQAMPVRPVHQAHGEMLPVAKMQRNVAAIVDIAAFKPRRIQHRAKNFFRDGARHRRHRRNEMIKSKRRHGRIHAARDRTLQFAARRATGLAQQRQLVAQFVEQTGKTPRRGVISDTLICLAAVSLHDQVDRTVLQMKPSAVREPSDLRNSRHVSCPGGD